MATVRPGAPGHPGWNAGNHASAESGTVAENGQRSFLVGLKRGLRRRCPNCGTGKFFVGYLTAKDRCEVCDHDNGQYPAYDGPPYFTILLVGHLVVAPLLAATVIWQVPTLYAVATLVAFVGLVTLTALLYVKGGVIGAQWGLRTPTISARADSGKRT